MSNASAAVKTDTLGSGPFIFDIPVKASTAIYKGTLIAQHSGGYAVPYSTSGGGCALGVAQHDVASTAVDGSMRIRIETKRGFCFTNGTSGDAFSETSKYGAPVYATDDHTVADNSNTGVNKCVGWFMGMESDGKVRVFVDAGYAYLIDALNALVLLTDTPSTADALRDNIVASMLAGLL
jgi:hypothetical protein